MWKWGRKWNRENTDASFPVEAKEPPRLKACCPSKQGVEKSTYMERRMMNQLQFDQETERLVEQEAWDKARQLQQEENNRGHGERSEEEVEQYEESDDAASAMNGLLFSS